MTMLPPLDAHARRRSFGDEGFSLVSAMFVLALLAVFALVAAGLATNESKTSFNELVHQRSVLAADSGGESGIAWLMTCDRPPMFDDIDAFRVKSDATNTFDLGTTQRFAYDVSMLDRIDANGDRQARIEGRAGYDFELFRDHYYRVDSDGQDGLNGNGSVTLVAQRIFRVGY